MLFQTTSAHEELRAKIRSFAEEEIKPLAFLMDQNNEFPDEAVKKLGKLGWMGIPYPKEYGGAGLDALSYAIAVEELARVDGDILVLFVFRLEFQRAALCDDAEVLVKLLLRHADAVIADTQRAAVLIRRKEDLEVVTIESRSAVRQGFIVKLIDRVARVGDQLAQKNLLMSINRVDHEIKKSFN